MMDRRNALRLIAAGGAVATLAPGAGWSAEQASGPARRCVVGCARGADGRDRAVVTDIEGRVLMDIVLPDRGHGPSVSPDGRTAMVPARRPGRFAAILDLDAMRLADMLETPDGRHFMGHGVFSPDGRHWVATENDHVRGRGMLSVWDVKSRKRVAEYETDGIGPHEILLDPGGGSVTVANGGILTDRDDRPREKLNIPTMKPNMRRISLADGAVMAGASLSADMHKVSLRHIDMAPDGTVLVAGQDQGPVGMDMPLLFVWPADGGALRTIELPLTKTRALVQYCGSVALDRTGRIGATASPRGGVAMFVDVESGAFLGQLRAPDGCGLARDTRVDGGFFLSSGTGRLDAVRVDAEGTLRREAVSGPNPTTAMWDNHLGAFG
ncbi:DUF1513 domain-containing protein [Marivibrio halodurans]|uniref:DUF1513 domain-containing protein n=1 Tax=Marivibrio halodurans TaxID=2039722 RepID=A0A8J7S0T7_9PROT|nr:DUF1513 domain-containing protein [Marivibrio halodurans]MBP5856558.1 DUF1513 domain-containing protein [Marivibrio halodurans]